MNHEEQNPMSEALIRRIEQVLSEILLDMYDCEVTLRVVKKNATEKKEQ